MNEHVILVNADDMMIGTMEKLAAHKTGKLHRAFSVFIFNSNGELLLQQRSFEKYHSGGLWTNTCCSHPNPAEDTAAAAHRRLAEEMGMKCELTAAFNFTYFAELDNGLTEHEFDHVYFGFCDVLPLLNTAEAIAYKYLTIENLRNDMRLKPEAYTQWLKICFDKVIEHYNLVKPYEPLFS